MKTILTFLGLMLFLHFGFSQSVTVTLNYNDIGCTVCGDATYACNNGWPGWAPLSFSDPVPVGNVVTKIDVRVFGTGCGNDLASVNLNNVSIGLFNYSLDCRCGGFCYQWSFPALAPIPSYNYGGSNQVFLVSNSTICIDRFELDIYYESACDVSVSAGDNQTVYLGYAPAATATLNATTSGGNAPLTINWYDDQSNLVGTGLSVNVSPQAMTSYTVEVTDDNGCTASDLVTVCVVDVRCGPNNNKVQLCHNDENPHTICVSANAVPDHLAHGDLLGSCDEQPGPCEDPAGERSTQPVTRTQGPIIHSQTESLSTSNAQESFFTADGRPVMKVLENPVQGGTNIQFGAVNEIQSRLQIIDLQGKVIAELFNGTLNAGEIRELYFNTGSLSAGIYICQMEAGTFVNQRKLVVAGQ